MQIHQMLASLEYGDAVASHALAIQRQLREWGHDSEIFAASRHPRAVAPSRPLEEMPASADVGILYHHAFWSDPIEARLRTLRGRLAMIYHNVTPAHYFAPYSAELESTATRAREAVAGLRDAVAVPLTVSDFNRRELGALGYRDVGLLPVPVAAEELLSTEPAPEVLRWYRDGWTNLLFVGRLTPCKRQEDVIRVFAWYHRFVDAASRLILVGAAPEIDAYRQDLARVAESLHVERHVVFTGKVSSSELAAYYRVADLFLCMSEHEGVCLPLLEAMAFDVPVIARAEGAVPETLGGAGVLARRRDVPRIAEAIRLLVSDRALRREVVQGQRRRLAELNPERFVAALDAAVRRLR